MKSRVPLWSSLRVRVVLGVVIPLVIILGFSALLQFANHRALMLENLEQISKSVGEGVETTLTHAMLSRDREQLAQVAQALAQRDSIQNLMILDHAGNVRIAAHASDVTKQILPDDPACLGCHNSTEKNASRSFLLNTAGGAAVFRNVTPILNRTECQGCHGAGATVNGILIIDLPFEPIQEHLWSDLRQNLLIAFGTILTVTLVINLLLSRMVLTRLERFRAALLRYTQADYAARVPVSGSDEIGELAVTMNGMASGLERKAQLEQEVQETSKKLAHESASLGALYRVALESSRSLNLDDVMRAGLETILNVLRMESGEIHLGEPAGIPLRLSAFVGSPIEFVKEEEQICRGECLCGSVAARGEACAIGDLGADERITRLACRRFGFRAVAAVPLRAHGRTLGVLTLHQRAVRQFSSEDNALLSALGDHLGIAIDNALLYAEMESRVRELSRQVQHLAVLEERDRLAREMHDGFAQVLALLNLKLQMAQASSNGNHQLATTLHEMRAVVDETYEDVRQAIGDLRTPLPADTALVTSLAEYAQNFALRYDLQPNVSIAPDAKESWVSPDVGIQVMRIVQETLANVRKHARARQLQVEFVRSDGHLEITIGDDGQGFDSAARTTAHFGLAIMRERAASFGGELEIRGQPGTGTTIMLRVPVGNEGA